jgi:hypothetical protein
MNSETQLLAKFNVSLRPSLHVSLKKVPRSMILNTVHKKLCTSIKKAELYADTKTIFKNALTNL